MKNIILNGWNVMRVLRLAIGILFIVQGVVARDWLLATLGGVFFLLPLLNIGCCGLASCHTNTSKPGKKSEDITYEEVH